MTSTRRWTVILCLHFQTAIGWAATSSFCAGIYSAHHNTEALKPAAKNAQQRQTSHTIVLFAHFQDELPNPTPIPNWAGDIFDPDRAGSFTHFYRTMSFQQHQVTGEVAPKRYASLSRAPTYLAAERDSLGRFGQFSREILQQADRDIDFARFDNDGPDGIANSGDDDGIVDAVFIVTASVPANFLLRDATGAATLGFEEDFISDDVSIDGSRIRIAANQGTIQQGRTYTETVGVIAHEYGHLLGLPDLYNTTFLSLQDPDPQQDSAGIGRWGLMGWGATGWNENDGPNPLCAWSRMQLGWASVQELKAAQQDITLADIGLSGAILKIPLSAQEFYLVENRRKDSTYYDRNMPAEGLLIWHIDRRRAKESFFVVVSLECADGKWQDAGFPQGRVRDPVQGENNLDFWAHDQTYTQAHSGNQGDATDIFDGKRFTEFSAATNPSSVGNGTEQSIAVEDIRFDGNLALARVRANPLTITLNEVGFIDENSDKVFMADEKVTVRFTLVNTGGLDATDVQVRLAGDDPNVALTRTESVFDRLRIGQQTIGGGSGFPTLHFQSTFTGTHAATLDLQLFANGLLLDTYEIALSGVSPRQRIRRATLQDSQGDGLAHPGEFIRFELELEATEPTLLSFVEFDLRSLSDELIPIGGADVLFDFATTPAKTQTSPEFLIPNHLSADQPLYFEFVSRTSFSTWRDTLSVQLQAGSDQTPPRVLGLTYRNGTDGLRLILPPNLVLDASPLQQATAVVYSPEDTTALATIPLVWQDTHFEGSWTGAPPGTYLARALVQDQAGNSGTSDWQTVTVLTPVAETPQTKTDWTLIDQPPRTFLPLFDLVAFAPSTPEVIYAADRHALWRSSDGGDQWQRTGFMAGGKIDHLSVDALDPQTVYVLFRGFTLEGPASILRKSQDSGQTWTTPDIPQQILSLVADPSHGSRLLATSSEQLYLSENGGATWLATAPTGFQFIEFAFGHPQDPRVLYITGHITGQNGLAVSTDLGASWTHQTVKDITGEPKVDPALLGGVYAIRQNVLWYSADHGAQWARLSDLPDRSSGVDTWWIQPLPNLPGRFLLWNTQGLWHNADGEDWERFELPAGKFGYGPFIHPTSPDRFLLFGKNANLAPPWNMQLWRTQNGGQDFQLASLGPIASPVGTLFFGTGGTIYAGSGRPHENGKPQVGFYLNRTGESGWSWQTNASQWINSQSAPGLVPLAESLYRDPANPQFMLAFVGTASRRTRFRPSTGGWYLQSTDAGSTWQRLGNISRSVQVAYAQLTHSPHRPGHYYIAGGGTSLYKSADAGQTWDQIDQGLPRSIRGLAPRIGGFAPDPRTPNVLYTAIGDVIWVSKDDGSDWQEYTRLDAGADILQLAFHPLDDHLFYAVTPKGLYLEDPGTGAWNLVSPLELKDYLPILLRLRLRFHPLDKASMYLATGPQLLKTTDSGHTWRSIGHDLASYPWFNDVAVDPFEPTLIYAATPWGIYRLDEATTTAVTLADHNLTATFHLGQNSPNPFNPETAISYRLAAPSQVRLGIYNLLGQQIRQLVDEFQTAGPYTTAWDGRNQDGQAASSGIYLYRLSATKNGAPFVRTKKMALIR